MTLEKGMFIYRKCPLNGRLGRFVVDRTTKTQAVIYVGDVEVRFARDVKDGSCFSVLGATRYTKSTYMVETDDCKAKYRRQQLENRFNGIDILRLTDEKLEALINLAV